MLAANGLLRESCRFTLLGHLLKFVVCTRRPAAEHFWKRNRKIWWILVSRNASNESCWMAASGLPHFFWGQKIKRMRIYRYISFGVQSDTFVSRWYANTLKSFVAILKLPSSIVHCQGFPYLKFIFFFPLLFQKCSAAGLRVRTANLSRWAKKVISKIRGVEHWWRAGQTKNKKWNACFAVSIIFSPAQISVLKHMGFLIRLHRGTQNWAYNLPTNLFCTLRVYKNETRQTCYAQGIQKDQWRD